MVDLPVQDSSQPIVKRRFSESKKPRRLPQPLSFYWAQKAIIVLGDPGSGKTTSFKQAAIEEPNSIYVSVRDFLSLRLER